MTEGTSPGGAGQPTTNDEAGEAGEAGAEGGGQDGGTLPAVPQTPGPLPPPPADDDGGGGVRGNGAPGGGKRHEATAAATATAIMDLLALAEVMYQKSEVSERNSTFEWKQAPTEEVPVGRVLRLALAHLAIVYSACTH